MKRSLIILFISGIILFDISERIQASPIVWTNNASSFPNPVILEGFDGSTGALSDQFAAPHPDASDASIDLNGRGMAIEGTTLYYSGRNYRSVYITDSITHADLGIAFNTDAESLNGIASISIFGSGVGKEFWLTDYGDYGLDINTTVYRYDAFGGFIGTISGFGKVREGFEIVQIGNVTKIISGSDYGGAPYNLYNLDGSLFQSNFIAPDAVEAHGITFDGTSFYVADQHDCQIEKYNLAGGLTDVFSLGCRQGLRLMEDLAVNKSIPIPISVPEPSVTLLMAMGILGFESYRRVIKRD